MIVPGSANSLLLAQGASTGYNLTKSLRFRASASAYLNRSLSSTSNRQTWTWSGWVKRGALDGRFQTIWFGGDNSTDTYGLAFNTDNTIIVGRYLGGTGWTWLVNASPVYRDPASWYHIVVALDTTQATASNRVKIYVNEVQLTSFVTANYPTQNYNTEINSSSVPQKIGYQTVSNNYGFDGYLAEVNFIDGQQLTPSSFGENNATTGVWQPKRYTGTYGTNGFYLPFTDTSSASPTGLGKDFSGTSSNVIVGSATNTSTTLTVVSTTGISVGNIVTGTGIPSNTYVTSVGVLQVTLSQAATATTASTNYTFSGNNWTVNNISLTAGSTYDSMTDVPTLTSASVANYCVLNPLQNGGTMTNGNLTFAGNTGSTIGTIAPSSGKWYFEATVATLGTSAYVGLADTTWFGTDTGWSYSQVYVYISSGNKGGNGSSVAYGASYTTGDVIGVAMDLDGGTVTFYKNNTSQGVAFNTGVSGKTLRPFVATTSPSTTTYNVNFGQQGFTYTPPTGYVALNTYNLPTSTIVKGNTVMDATTYTGTGASLSVTNAGFKPDLVWIKSRSAATDHKLTDSVRGTTKALISDTTGAETTDANGLTAFGTSGFTVGTDTVYNNNTATYVGWQWQAGQGTTSSNTSGSVTSTVSVNASAGFSIVTYTGNGSSSATVGHGLGVAPSLIFTKHRSDTSNWMVMHTSLSSGYNLRLNTTDAQAQLSGTTYGGISTSPTSTTFGFTSGTSGVDNSNANGVTMIAYCWAEIAGFSKFGSYTGNGSTDGPFIYTGFRPKFVLYKRTDTTGDWYILDTSRSTYNAMNNVLFPNASNAEDTGGFWIDGLSNGFKQRGAGANSNANGGTYIYAAFAENPTKYALAR